jgi:hypothetical protein
MGATIMAIGDVISGGALVSLLGIGVHSTQSGVSLDLSTSGGAVYLPVLTTTQRNALAVTSNGYLIYNSTTETVQVYDGGAGGSWRSV